ncbi:MAG: mitofilin family membrane protein [Methyloceanibacter sp.]
MAEPIGSQDQAAAPKRPAPTIEGTATEVSIEPSPEAEGNPESPADPTPPPDAAEPPHLTDGTADADGDANGAPPRPAFAAVKGFMTHLAAGLAGGVIGVAALALAWNHLDSGGEAVPPAAVANLEQRIAELEAAPPATGGDTIAQLEQRLAAIERDGTQAPGEIATLEGRIAQLESSLKAMAETAEEGGSVASTAAIGQQIAEAEQRLNEQIAAARAEGETASVALGEMQSEIAALKAKLGALAEAEFGVDSDLGPELNALSDRIAKLEATLPELVGALGKEAAGVKSAAVAIAFANLRAAVTDGRAYGAELDTIGALAPALGDLGILPAHAEKGIPTVPELVRGFDIARDNALAATATPQGESFLANLWASAQGLVTIRRIDEAPVGEGPDPTLARAKAALDKGDLEAAVKQVETLSGPARESFAAWIGQVRARLGADAILARLEGTLLVSMSGEAPQQP